MQPLYYSLPGYLQLAQDIFNSKGSTAIRGISGSLITQVFPDGERYHRLKESEIRDQTVILVGGTVNDAATLDLYDLSCALVKYGARKLILVVPYWGYSTMERKVKDGEIVKMKTRARLFSSLPRAPLGNTILLVDLHTDSTYFFEGDIVPVHVYAQPLIRIALAQFQAKAANRNMVLATTDSGRAKWVESLAQDLGLDTAFVLKRRVSGSESHIVAVTADVRNKPVVIYDDMIRTGGSLINAAKAYRNAGAAQIQAIASHGVFPEGAVLRLQQSGLFDSITVTNSHPRATEEAIHHPEFIKLLPLHPLIQPQLLTAIPTIC